MSADRDPRQVAQELAEFDRADQLAQLTDPTGVDCAEAYESAEDQG